MDLFFIDWEAPRYYRYSNKTPQIDHPATTQIASMSADRTSFRENSNSNSDSDY